MNSNTHEDFKRLKAIASILFPIVIIAFTVLAYNYRYSLDIVETKVVDKEIAWFDSCSEGNCIELPIFYVITSDEKFTTNEALFDQVEKGSNYLFGAKGWNVGAVKRELTHIY